MIEFTVSNDGPVIPVEIINRVFDAYFTAGKRGGTGLGLAIAKKIVLAHGGEIACDTDLKQGVKFRFTLPTADVVSSSAEHSLPNSIQDTSQGLSRLAAEESCEVAIQESEAERLFVSSFGADDAIKVLIVDDEAIFRNAVADIIQKRPSVNERVEILLASNSQAATELALRAKPHIIILDLDLGADSVSGLEVAAHLKKAGSVSHICIHTNRIFSAASQKEMALISDSFLPKPISAVSLLTLLKQAALQAKQQKVATPTAKVSNEVFVLVEDSLILRTKWKHMWTRGQLVTFAKPADFWARVAEHPQFLDLLTAVFTDQNFDNEPGIDGLAFAKELRRRSAVPIFLETQERFSADEIKDSVDGLVDKEPPSDHQITKLLSGLALKG
jgi:CheY-like chemotaxis protein